MKYKKEYMIALRKAVEKKKKNDADDAGQPLQRRRRVDSSCSTSPPQASDSKKGNSVMSAAEERTVMIEAAVNAVMLSLFYRTIIAAWKASGLSPLRKHPPYTREKTENLKKQAMEMGVLPEQKKSVHLAGVITDTQALEDIRSLIAKRGKAIEKARRIVKTVKTIFGPKERLYEIDSSLSDVEDEVVLDDEPEADTPRRRGRPRKRPVERVPDDEGYIIADEPSSIPPRRRGRPRKRPVERVPADGGQSTAGQHSSAPSP